MKLIWVYNIFQMYWNHQLEEIQIDLFLIRMETTYMKTIIYPGLFYIFKKVTRLIAIWSHLVFLFFSETTVDGRDLMHPFR